MRIENDVKIDFCDVLVRPKRSTISSRQEVILERTFAFKHTAQTWTGVPVISANMPTVTTVASARELKQHGMLSCFPKELDQDTVAGIMMGARKDVNFYHCDNTMFSFGLDTQTIKTKMLYYHSLGFRFQFMCLDVANGYMEKFVDTVKWVREKYPKQIIIAGNVVSPEMTEALILAGADIVKVGLGSGGACSTRTKTAVGYPQLSAVIECADSAHGLGGHIISDGGCVAPSDVVKAFGAGADFVMLGSMLAGHEENKGDKTSVKIKKGESHILHYGMSSDLANKRHAGGLKTYRAAEGRVLWIPYRGEIGNTLQEIEGGLRSACSYVGATKLKDLPKCVTFVRVNRQLNNSLMQYESGY